LEFANLWFPHRLPVIIIADLYLDSYVRQWDCVEFASSTIVAWGARGPGFKSRRPDQIPQRLAVRYGACTSCWSPSWSPNLSRELPLGCIRAACPPPPLLPTGPPVPWMHFQGSASFGHVAFRYVTGSKPTFRAESVAASTRRAKGSRSTSMIADRSGIFAGRDCVGEGHADSILGSQDDHRAC
jgi:hypothetical protein